MRIVRGGIEKIGGMIEDLNAPTCFAFAFWN